jgi:hypothetical protein
MMKRGCVLLLALVGCGPNFESGKTECSDKLECPSGYTCGSEHKGSTPVCYSETNCVRGTPFFCKWANLCASGPAQCPGPDLCTDADFPEYCPASGGASAGCWESGVDCQSVTSCDGVPAACSIGGRVYCAGEPGRQCCRPPQVGGQCNVPACGCPSGQVCFPYTVATGLVCLKTTGVLEGAACGTNDVCAEGSGCFGGLCRPYCNTVGDCLAVDNARACNSTYWSEDQTIPGVSVCGRVCDPVSPQAPRAPLLACPTGFGCMVGDGSPGASDCFRQAGTLTAGATCASTSDCAPGHYCTVGDYCNQFCFTSADCPSGTACNFFATPQYAGTVQVGYCK